MSEDKIWIFVNLINKQSIKAFFQSCSLDISECSEIFQWIIYDEIAADCIRRVECQCVR